MVIEGLLMREVELLGRFSAELLGQGDLLRPWDIDGEFTPPVPTEVRWTVLTPVTLAVLTERFLRRAADFPAVISSLMRRAVGRSRALAVHDAITNFKHIETRLLVQFWHFAERWGTVGPQGIKIPIPLTHEMLAKLVGAARPSVTTELGRLAARDLLVRDHQDWWLSHHSADPLEPMPLEPDTALPA